MQLDQVTRSFLTTFTSLKTAIEISVSQQEQPNPHCKLTEIVLIFAKELLVYGSYQAFPPQGLFNKGNIVVFTVFVPQKFLLLTTATIRVP